ncbi:MAG: hypothetical protein HY717_06935 [Planctomycetes bacterium]|nr:hypothetical protein [Planctomycetota bacterium]
MIPALKSDSSVDPVVITGLGLVTAAGSGAAAFWRAFQRKESHLGRLRQIDAAGLSVGRGGEVPDELLEPVWLDMPGRDAGDGGDRALRLAALAAREALDDAGLLAPRREVRIGLALGTALGAVQTLERLAAGRAPESAWRAVSPDQLSSAVAERFGLAGPRWTFSVTCVSGLYALEQAAVDLERGRAGAMLVGGLDTLSRFMQSGFCALKALSPSGQLRPFDLEHDGILLGEGAAFILLETASRARERGARSYGAVLENRLISDAAHLTSPDGSGKGMAEAIRQALAGAGISPGEIGCITPTATGSPIYDRMQSRAALEALGARGAQVPATTWEPAVGHLLAGTGIAGAVHAALVLDRGAILPSFGVESKDPECRLRYVLDGEEPFRGRSVLALTVGFGGQNGATLIGLPPPASGPARAPEKAPSPPQAAIAAAAAAGRYIPSGDGAAKAAELFSPARPEFSTDPESLAALFPGRWNPRRELPPGLGPLVQTVASALQAAGWWEPGQPDPVPGGLALGTDWQGLAAALPYARDLARSGPAGASPSGFLFSLPSSAAAVLGILFGLRDYQATITGGALSGFQALSHAIDRLAGGKASRLVAGALTIATPELRPFLEAGGVAAPGEEAGTLELAAAACLEPGGGDGACRAALVEGRDRPLDPAGGAVEDAPELERLPAGFRRLAAPALFSLFSALEHGKMPCLWSPRDPAQGARPRGLSIQVTGTFLKKTSSIN